MRVAEEEVISSFTFAHEPQHFPALSLSLLQTEHFRIHYLFVSLSLSLSPSFFSGIGTLCLHSLSRFLSAEWRRSSLSSFFSGQPAAVRRFYFVQRKRQSQQLSAGRRLAPRERKRSKPSAIPGTEHRHRERERTRQRKYTQALSFLSLFSSSTTSPLLKLLQLQLPPMLLHPGQQPVLCPISFPFHSLSPQPKHIQRSSGNFSVAV